MMCLSCRTITVADNFKLISSCISKVYHMAQGQKLGQIITQKTFSGLTNSFYYNANFVDLNLSHPVHPVLSQCSACVSLLSVFVRLLLRISSLTFLLWSNLKELTCALLSLFLVILYSPSSSRVFICVSVSWLPVLWISLLLDFVSLLNCHASLV